MTAPTVALSSVRLHVDAGGTFILVWTMQGAEFQFLVETADTAVRDLRERAKDERDRAALYVRRADVMEAAAAALEASK